MDVKEKCFVFPFLSLGSSKSSYYIIVLFFCCINLSCSILYVLNNLIIRILLQFSHLYSGCHPSISFLSLSHSIFLFLLLLLLPFNSFLFCVFSPHFLVLLLLLSFPVHCHQSDLIIYLGTLFEN